MQICELITNKYLKQARILQISGYRRRILELISKNTKSSDNLGISGKVATWGPDQNKEMDQIIHRSRILNYSSHKPDFQKIKNPQIHDFGRIWWKSIHPKMVTITDGIRWPALDAWKILKKKIHKYHNIQTTNLLKFGNVRITLMGPTLDRRFLHRSGSFAVGWFPHQCLQITSILQEIQDTEEYDLLFIKKLWLITISLRTINCNFLDDFRSLQYLCTYLKFWNKTFW